jgi:hypothetical protein
MTFINLIGPSHPIRPKIYQGRREGEVDTVYPDNVLLKFIMYLTRKKKKT